MELRIASPATTAELHDPANLRQLRVVAPASIAPGALAEALAGWGRLDGDHAWLRIATLREAVVTDADVDPTAFDGMIDYARKAGWVDASGEHVRAHIERDDGPGTG